MNASEKAKMLASWQHWQPAKVVPTQENEINRGEYSPHPLTPSQGVRETSYKSGKQATNVDTGKRKRMRVSEKQDKAVKSAVSCVAGAKVAKCKRKPNGTLASQWGKGGYLVNSKLR